MTLSVKRVYDKPSKTDGTRALVDGLWPRGVRKADAHIDVWAKELTPSSELRAWFHADPDKRFETFTKKYRKELTAKKAERKELLKSGKRLTLVTAVRDIEHSHVPTLVAFLKKCPKKRRA